MIIEKIKQEILQLKELSNDDAYADGLNLLKILKANKNEIDEKTYIKLENEIQEQRFRE